MRRTIFFSALLSLLLLPLPSLAASLNVSPATGVFTVGSTFTATITIDTDDRPVNIFEAVLKFPADKLQVISPSTGESIASVWVGQPKFDNRAGTIELRGGIPGGIVAKRGVIATILFRAKGVGGASLKFEESSKILASDGAATNVLNSATGANFRVVLPPSAGPLVASPTHPDQDRWYVEPQVILNWKDEADGYSYILTQNPVEVPDDISEGTRTTVTYGDVANGVWYFHIKSLRDGSWGGVSHFAAHVDREPPAEFSVDVVSGAHTTQTQPVIQFFSTDSTSGMNYFEVKIVPLGSVANAGADDYLFVEASSPYVAPELALGKYDVIVRAYDKAGNYRSSTQRLEIVEGVGRFFNDDGIVIGRSYVMSWVWVLAVAVFLTLLVATSVHFVRRRHERIGGSDSGEMLPADVKAQLKELQMYRRKYSKTLLIFLAMLAGLSFGRGTLAATPLAPPLITNVSDNISNQDIFYIGGKAAPEAKVLLHLQSSETGEVLSEEANSDLKGNWFYRHSGFLRTGEYIIWAQVSIGEEMSPPSPQALIHVETTAFEFGSSRLSYALIYFVTTILLAIFVIVLLLVLAKYAIGIRKRRQILLADLRMTEERIRRGFAVLRKDVEAELALLNQKGGAALLPEEKSRAEELRGDIERISSYIGAEIWELEKDAAS